MTDSTPAHGFLPGRAALSLARISWAWLVTGVALGQLAYFLLLSTLRLIDGDEGYYLYAGRLVLEGRVPYRDFFYTQMPLMPYLHAAVYAFTGPGWIEGRLISVLSSAALGTCIFLHLARIIPNRIWALWGVAIYSASWMAIDYYSVAKTYAFSAFTVFLAWQLVVRKDRSASWWCLLSGFVIGLAIDARLMMAGTVPALAWGSLRGNGPSGWNFRAAVAFCAGLGIALLAVLPLWATDPPSFIFGNFTYHSIRSHLDFGASLSQKLLVAREFVGLHGIASGASAIQNIGLLALSVLSMGVRSGSGRGPALIHGVMALILITCFLPNPAFTQYFCVLLPFLVVCTVEVLAGIQRLLLGRGLRKLELILRWMAAGYFAIFFLAGMLAARRSLITGNFVSPVNTRDNAPNWRIKEMGDITDLLNTRVPPGEAVLTWWPGYCLESSATVLEGLENHFGQEIGPKLDAATRAEHGILAPDDIERLIRAREVRFVLLGNWTGDWISSQRDKFIKVLNESGYQNTAQIGTAWLFEAAPVLEE